MKNNQLAPLQKMNSNVDPDFPERTVPDIISQSELNDLVRDLNLSEIQAEILASQLQGWNLLQKVVKPEYWKCQQSLSPFCFLNRAFHSNHITTRVHIHNNILTDRHYGFVTLKDFELPDDGFD
jgi:hypothetical protein